ncbi:MAG TPA: ribbon-helix-helix protein, CopG family [Acidimicrobiia bacterium]|nr:ribbon-helix-helix protein, CopG family [Acidimicrobiia bacterium]
MAMKMISITIPADLDRRAAAEARRRGVSKSELVRQGIIAVLETPAAPVAGDFWSELGGFGPPGVTVDPATIDEVVL